MTLSEMLDSMKGDLERVCDLFPCCKGCPMKRPKHECAASIIGDASYQTKKMQARMNDLLDSLEGMKKLLYGE